MTTLRRCGRGPVYQSAKGKSSLRRPRVWERRSNEWLVGCQSMPQSHSAEGGGGADALLCHHMFGSRFVFEATFLTVDGAGSELGITEH